MKKPKDKKLRFIIVLIICVFLLIIITLYFKFASIKQTYALNEFEYKKNSLVVVSDAKNINIDDIYKVISTDTTEVKLEEDGKQNVSFFIDAYSTEILVSCIGKSLDNDFIEFNLDLLNSG